MTNTLYASVLELNRSDIKALRVTDCYSLHRVVYSLFEDVRADPDKAASVSSGIQWADKGGNFNSRQILILSDRAPAEAIDGKFGTVRTKPLPGAFLDHQLYRFTVIVNPVTRNNATRKLVPVKGREAIADWFLQRAQASWGFAVDQSTMEIHKIDVLQFNDKAQRTVTLQQAHITGFMRVSDPDTFEKSFRNGIGKGRSFGCGLLQIIPITPQEPNQGSSHE